MASKSKSSMNVGWGHIWKLYGWEALLSKKNKLFYFTIIVVATFLILIIINNQDNLAYSFINNTVDIGISSLPTLLGFNLGAYALIIGFLSNKNLLNALLEKQENETANSLEKISAVFAFNIIVQAFTLLVLFVVKQAMSLIKTINLNDYWDSIFYNDKYVIILNYSIFFIVMFLTVYSICLVIQNAINIFDFNQLFTHFSLKRDKDEK